MPTEDRHAAADKLLKALDYWESHIRKFYFLSRLTQRVLLAIADLRYQILAWVKG